MRADIQDDLKYADNLESGLFWFPGSGLSRQLPTVLRSPVSVREAAASGGVYTTQDTKFAMLRSEFQAEALPEVGGLIEVEDEVWTVYGIDRAAHRGRFLCWCKLELIRGELASTVKIQKPNYTRDADLVSILTWTDVVTSLPAKIQEVGSELIVEQERRRIKVTHRIYTDTTEGVTQAGWRCLDISGGSYLNQPSQTPYNILRITGRGVLGTLEVFDAELARKPQAL